MEEIIVLPPIQNADNPYEGAEIYGDVIPARIVILGGSGDGKSWLIKNFILNPNEKDNPFWLDYDIYHFFSGSTTEGKPELWKSEDWEVDVYDKMEDITQRRVQKELKDNLKNTPSKHGIIVFDDPPQNRAMVKKQIGEYYRVSRKLGYSLVSVWHTIKEVPELVASNATLWIIFNHKYGEGELRSIANRTKFDRQRLKELSEDQEMRCYIINTMKNKLYRIYDSENAPEYSDSEEE